MKLIKTKLWLLVPAALLMSGCWLSRFVSADDELESLYVGKTYYEVIDDFGRPDATIDDGMQGTRAIYRNASLNGTRAAGLYREFNMRNRATRQYGEPEGNIEFVFNAKMRCYAVNSNLQHERVKVKKEKEAPRDPNRWAWQNPKVPRVIDFPTVERISPTAENVSIERIEVNADNVKVHLRYHGRTPKNRPVNDYGICVMPETYIENADTRRRSALIDVEGISLYPERTFFAHNNGGYDMLNYTLTFEPVERSTVKINIVEPGHSGFNFYGVDISTRIVSRLE